MYQPVQGVAFCAIAGAAQRRANDAVAATSDWRRVMGVLERGF
jgi:hypothetical protein